MAETSAPAFNRAYTGLRRDILAVLPFTTGSATTASAATPGSAGAPGAPAAPKVLDIGCATGSMGQYLADTFSAKVWGVEYDPAMAEVARGKMQGVWHADLNRERLASLPHPGRYDLVICGDVLEHLVDPWAALADIASLLEPGGSVAVSMPNIGHYTTLAHLAFFREWPYRKRGIHDRTHLRFFTRRNMVELYRSAGLRPVKEKRMLRFWESGSPVDPLAKAFDFFPFRSFLTFQYIHLLRKE